VPLTHQLVVLCGPTDECEALLPAVVQRPLIFGLALRDAALLTRQDDGDVMASEPIDRWTARRKLGHDWWQALVIAVTDLRSAHARTLITDGVSKSFLEELAGVLAAETAAVVLIGAQVDVGMLMQEIDTRAFARVIYGSLPESAIDDLFDLAATG
jgi:hypothetical protein